MAIGITKHDDLALIRENNSSLITRGVTFKGRKIHLRRHVLGVVWRDIADCSGVVALHGEPFQSGLDLLYGDGLPIYSDRIVYSDVCKHVSNPLLKSLDPTANEGAQQINSIQASPFPSDQSRDQDLYINFFWLGDPECIQRWWRNPLRSKRREPE